MSVFLVASDIFSISISILTAIVLNKQFRPDLELNVHLVFIPVILIFFILTYRLMSLYPGIGIGPVEELKRLTTSTSFLIIAVTASSFFLRSTIAYSRTTLMLSWALILINIPLSRKIFRRIAVKLGVWGIPVAIVGERQSVKRIQKNLSLHPLTGLWPVLCIDGLSMEEDLNALLSQINTLILVADQESFEIVPKLIADKSYQFKKIILILDEIKIGPIWFMPINIAEHLGFEVTNNLLDPMQQFVKRCIEIGIILLFAPILLLLFICIASAIKLNSKGPVFYKHKRVGYHGKSLWIWKFRSMHHESNVKLEEYLENNPSFQKEWRENFKLKKDPRITIIGKLLRNTSLDELPQLWNVLNGEMSLIGPRPIVEEEIPLYGKEFEVYKQVHPGITGLWQISGRNDLPYQERVILDVYYTENWSIWLDIHILIHTTFIVLLSRGAY